MLQEGSIWFQYRWEGADFFAKKNISFGKREFCDRRGSRETRTTRSRTTLYVEESRCISAEMRWDRTIATLLAKSQEASHFPIAASRCRCSCWRTYPTCRCSGEEGEGERRRTTAATTTTSKSKRPTLLLRPRRQRTLLPLRPSPSLSLSRRPPPQAPPPPRHPRRTWSSSR